MTEVLRVTTPGPSTTVQDLGRPNALSSGVPTGGAMDRFAHRAANLLVGNHEGAPTLECLLRGPHLVVLDGCHIAITGGDFDLRVNGQSEPIWQALALKAGDEIVFGGRRAGGRIYIAVAGGIAADRWLGSSSTSLLAGRGGMHGRALAAGDVIQAGLLDSNRAAPGRHLAESLRPAYADRVLHAIAGPHAGRLRPAERNVLFSSTFRVSPESDRMGYRLEGAVLEPAGDELLSFGLVAGALQVPPGGRPILLMADHPTAGGYPVVVTVASASMPVAAQLVPGDDLRFAEVTVAAALRMRADQRAALDSLI